MNQTAIGKFIALKRKEQNLTQGQLAEKLGISNKTISKWETGKCMPDYGIIQALCKELNITITELMDGETKDKTTMYTVDESQILDMMSRIQRLEKQKQTLLGMMLMIMGAALLALSQLLGGSTVKELFSGILLGISVGEMLIGVYIVSRSLWGLNQ